ncbi:MAG: glycosyltransferase family 39 protein, partial [Betaproteobacteria bacterium]
MRRDASPLGWLLALALAMALLAGYRVWMLGHLGIDLFFDESQYWFWSTELAWGYYSKPPAIALLIGWSTALLGNDLLGVKAPAIVLNALSPLLAFAIGARLAGARTGFLAALVVATLPIVAGLALFVTTDSPLIFFWLLGTWALLRAIAHDRWRDWLLLGASVGLGLLSKYTRVAFGLSAALAQTRQGAR